MALHGGKQADVIQLASRPNGDVKRTR